MNGIFWQHSSKAAANILFLMYYLLSFLYSGGVESCFATVPAGKLEGLK